MSGKDAAMFPIIASCTLFGIYLIFQVRPKLNLSPFMTFTRWYLSHQGSHWLEKYMNMEGFIEKSLKIKSVLKSTGK